MIKKVVVLVIIASAITACSKKTVPVIMERKTNPSQPVITNLPLTITPDMAIRKVIFTNRCGKCHGLPEPLQYTVKRWDGIISYMIPRAKLSDEQAIHVSAYIKSTAAK